MSEAEVEDVLRKPLEETRGRGVSVIAIGQTRAGRYLRVVYSPDADGRVCFCHDRLRPASQATAGAAPPATETTMKKVKDPNRYPKGLNRKKVRALIDYYDNQSDANAIAEAEASYRRRSTSWVEVPVKLLPAVRQLIARGAPVQ